ncbi:MAG: hypothetical protein Kow00124_30530 [Anaerolineae bacterium]
MLGSSAAGLGCLTPVLIVGAIFLGRWLDSLFGTAPLILLSLVLLAIPVSLMVVINSAATASRLEQEKLALKRREDTATSREQTDNDWEDGH